MEVDTPSGLTLLRRSKIASFVEDSRIIALCHASRSINFIPIRKVQVYVYYVVAELAVSTTRLTTPDYHSWWHSSLTLTTAWSYGRMRFHQTTNLQAPTAQFRDLKQMPRPLCHIIKDNVRGASKATGNWWGKHRAYNSSAGVQRAASNQWDMHLTTPYCALVVLFSLTVSDRITASWPESWQYETHATNRQVLMIWCVETDKSLIHEEVVQTFAVNNRPSLPHLPPNEVSLLLITPTHFNCYGLLERSVDWTPLATQTFYK